MRIPEALTAIRELDTLPESRRRYLVALVGTAPTDAARALIVLNARYECRTVREKTESVLRAELAARRDWAARNPPRPAEERTEPSKRRYTMAEGVRFPEHRPVSVRYVAPRKTAPEKTEHRPLIGTNRTYEEGKAPEAKVSKSRKRAPEHGLTGYNQGCRCDDCRLAKRLSRNPTGTRRANGEFAPCGTTTKYQRGCRCAQCRAVKAEHAREARKRKRAE